MRGLCLMAAVLGLLLVAFASKCGSECTLKQKTCCDGKIKGTNTPCTCNVVELALENQQREVHPYIHVHFEMPTLPPMVGNVLSTSEEETQEDEDAEMTLEDLPVCSLSCKQVCMDCSNDASITHSVKIAGNEHLCASKKQFVQLAKNYKEEYLNEALAQCSRVCTRCSLLTEEAAAVLSE